MKAYDVHFDDSISSNSKGFNESLAYCKGYINTWNGSNHSYFRDYKGGLVSVVCNKTGNAAHSEIIK